MAGDDEDVLPAVVVQIDDDAVAAEAVVIYPLSVPVE